MDLRISPTYKQFLQVEKINAKEKITLPTILCKNKESLPHAVMIKQHIYEDKLAGQTWIDSSPGI